MRQITQLQVAKRCNLDVSSCNKILNKVPGPVFSKSTIQRVFKVAKEMGYDFDKPHKGRLKSILQALFPKDVHDGTLAVARGVSIGEVEQIKSLLYKSAVVLLTLKYFITLP